MLLNVRRIAERCPSMTLLAVTDVTERDWLEHELIAWVESGAKLIDAPGSTRW